MGKPDAPVSGLDMAPVSGIRLVNALYIVTLHHGLNAGRAAISNYEWYTAAVRTPTLPRLPRLPLRADARRPRLSVLRWPVRSPPCWLQYER